MGIDDAFCRSFDRSKALPVLTAGVASLPSDVRAKAICEAVPFAEFAEDNDPPGEHNSGASILSAACNFP
ncbi:MAG: DUF3768 domain-containing protein [Alphaproteobacteria bacterium]|nr:DUF3768 domain-containing protein [Alphaproteobacteria bacterium]